jgi:eukaryotic-like serine/threonine-protein kinase
MSENRSSEAATSRLAPGTRLNGIFEIEQRVATGGMGEIYRGHAIETGDPVAIKVMRTDLAENIPALALFRKEASALHHIQHDAVVRYYIFSSDPVVGRHYLAMEFVDGRSLLDLLREGPLTFEAVRELQQRLAAGLHAAHQHGIIHRDVAPDNILIPNGDVARAKIIDFGIARSTRMGDGTIIGGGFAGKHSYVSPEQIGLFGGNVTAKSDIYSLGLVLAQCLSGQPIDMGGSQFEVIEKRRVLPNLGAVDLRYRPLLEHMLQPDPNDRPASMAEVAAWRPDVDRSNRPAPVRRRGRSGMADVKPARSARPIGADLARKAALAAVILVLLAGFGSIAFFLVHPLWAPKFVDAGAKPPPLATAAAGSLAAPKSANAAGPALAPPAPPAASSAAPVATAPITPAIPSAPAGPEMTAEAAARISRYANSYQGGDCFFAAPTMGADGRLVIDAYAAAVTSFETFLSDFKRANGFDAPLNPHRISEPQCPAIAFLSRLRGSPGSAPRLADVADLRSGSTLSGTLGDPGDRHVDLLLIADDGLVYNITSRLVPGAGERMFSLVIRLVETGPPRPQLIIAVASNLALTAFKLPQAAMGSLGAADQVFPRAINEARQSGELLTASVKYFRLEN